MDITRPEANGLGNRGARRAPTVNLTYEQNVVKNHSGIDSLPGYVLVVFEKTSKGGEIFSRLIKANERFPPGLRMLVLGWSHKYFSIAVNDTVLSYTFNHRLTLDDGSDEFDLEFRLSYRVADPQKIAQTREHDPLNQLRNEIVQAIGDNCKKRKGEMFRAHFRDLEKVVVARESANLSAYATTLGFKIISIKLDKPLADYQRRVIDEGKRAQADKQSHVIQQDVAHTKQKATREWDQLLQKDDVNHKFNLTDQVLTRTLGLQQKEDDVQRAQLNQELRKSQTDAIKQAFTNVGVNINTPADLREGYEVAREISAGIQSGNSADPSPTALPVGSELLAVASGEDRLSGLLAQVFREVDRWNCTFAHKQTVRSTLLHIVAEAMLDDHADDKLLKEYANKLSELGKNSQPPLGSSQRLFLTKFLNLEELKDKLR